MTELTCEYGKCPERGLKVSVSVRGDKGVGALLFLHAPCAVGEEASRARSAPHDNSSNMRDRDDHSN